MELKLRRIAEVLSRQSKSKIMLGGLSLTMLAGPNITVAQTAEEAPPVAQLEPKEEIIVTGTR